MRVCVVGASGFIGSNLSKMNPLWKALSRQDLDLLNQSAVEEFFSKNSFDVVIHSAACLKQNRCSTTYTNILMFENLLHAFTGKILYISSGVALKGSPPTEPYALSKWIIEQRSKEYDHVKCIRIWGCYGNGELPTRFSAVCRESKHVTILRDRLFDFVSVSKLNDLLTDYVQERCSEKFYNLYETAEPLLLSEWATIFGATCEIQDVSSLEEPYTSPR
uniref:NAD-dependent epimerase/dehydratase domain-containing protein n=1 Tax=Micromonas pusilla TaxID=38833 RepID=A0A6U0IU33_MICPS|mmetsp:Transcript_4863/g.17395  ORF Transcript_4863/g.17395 Transcript_4863/m.17395 type:complete len:219 (+) Transcript_4863:453-1109(+)